MSPTPAPDSDLAWAQALLKRARSESGHQKMGSICFLAALGRLLEQRGHACELRSLTVQNKNTREALGTVMVLAIGAHSLDLDGNADGPDIIHNWVVNRPNLRLSEPHNLMFCPLRITPESVHTPMLAQEGLATIDRMEAWMSQAILEQDVPKSGCGRTGPRL